MGGKMQSLGHCSRLLASIGYTKPCSFKRTHWQRTNVSVLALRSSKTRSPSAWQRATSGTSCIRKRASSGRMPAAASKCELRRKWARQNQRYQPWKQKPSLFSFRSPSDSKSLTTTIWNILPNNWWKETKVAVPSLKVRGLHTGPCGANSWSSTILSMGKST